MAGTRWNPRAISPEAGQDAAMTNWKKGINRVKALIGGGVVVLLHGWALLALHFWFTGHAVMAWGVVISKQSVVLLRQCHRSLRVAHEPLCPPYVGKNAVQDYLPTPM